MQISINIIYIFCIFFLIIAITCIVVIYFWKYSTFYKYERKWRNIRYKVQEFDLWKRTWNEEGE